MTDVIQYFPVATPVQTYRINIPVRGRLTLSMDPSGFIPHIVGMRGTDTFIGQTPAGIPASRVNFTTVFNAGEARFHLGTRSTASTFTVQTVFQPESAASAAPADTSNALQRVLQPRSTKAALRRAAKAHSPSTPLFQ